MSLPLASAQDVEVLRPIILDHTIRGMSFEAFVDRLRGERERFDKGYFPRPASRFLATLVIVADRLDYRGIAKTSAVWRRQSCPWIDIAIAPMASGLDEASLVAALSSWHRQEPVRILPEDHRHWAAELASDFVVFARPGDLVHPSMAAALCAASMEEAFDLFTWNELFRSAQRKAEPLTTALRPGWRRPTVEPVTLRHVACFGLGFAVRSNLVWRYPDRLLDDVARNEAHLFQNWAVAVGAVGKSSPEHLSTRAHRNRPRSAAERLEPLLDDYRRFFAVHAPDFALLDTGVAGQPYALSPQRRAASISVIVPFRDRPELTVRCLQSIAEQSTNAEVELLLIDNESSRDALNEVKVGLARLPGRLRWQLIRYDGRFNHSAECNLGAEAATGEALVFMNNDAYFTDPGTLDEISAWALVEGVSTVGPRLASENGEVVWTGMRLRDKSGGHFDFPLHDSRDKTFQYAVRESLGMSFALAAISRERFLNLGGLDPARFPNGYNDADFALRARRAGLTSIYLGHLSAVHKRGASRNKADEFREQMLLRMLHGDTLSETLFQLEGDERLTAGATGGRQSGAPRAVGAPGRKPTLAERAMADRTIGALLRVPAIRKPARLVYRSLSRGIAFTRSVRRHPR